MDAFGRGDTLFLADASGYLHRDFASSQIGDPVYRVNSRGEPIGALKRFMERAYWWREKGAANRYPTHFAFIFDAARRSFRHEICSSYKADRPPTPPDLAFQLPLMRECVEALGIHAVAIPTYEADDILAVYALTACEQDGDVLIISADKDLLALHRPGITQWDPPAGLPSFRGYRPERTWGHDEIVAQFGVGPELICDLLALAGDASDGIKGVPGIGMVTAAQLLREWGSLDGVLANAQHVKQPKRRDALIRHAEDARLAKRLVSLDTTAEYELPLEALRLEPLDIGVALAFAEKWELPSMIRILHRVGGHDGGSDGEVQRG